MTCCIWKCDLLILIHINVHYLSVAARPKPKWTLWSSVKYSVKSKMHRHIESTGIKSSQMYRGGRSKNELIYFLYSESGRGGSSLRREPQTSLSPVTSFSSYRGIPRGSQASQETYSNASTPSSSQVTDLLTLSIRVRALACKFITCKGKNLMQKQTQWGHVLKNNERQSKMWYDYETVRDRFDGK